MENNKYKKRKRIICIICATIIALYVFAVPISAIVNSTQGSFNDFTLNAQSTFPLTLGFSYSTRDPELGVGNTYVYSTEIGGYGEEWNTTLYGYDNYTHNYVPFAGTEYELEGYLNYEFIERTFDDDANIVWNDGSFTSTIKRGNQVLSLKNSINGIQRGVVFRASDIVYNPAWLITTEDGTSLSNEAMLPCFLSPNVENPNEQRLVFVYQYEVYITDQNGNRETYTGTLEFDTLENNSSRYVPLIPLDVLKNYQYQKTIIIDQLYGYLEVKAYDYIEDSIEGTYLIKSSLSSEEITSLPYVSLYPDGVIGTFNTPDGSKDITYFSCSNSSKRVVLENEQDYATITLYSSQDQTSTGFNEQYVRYSVWQNDDYAYSFYDKNSSIAESYRTITIDSSIYEVLGSYDIDRFSNFLDIACTQTSQIVEPYWREKYQPMDTFSFKFSYPVYDTSGVVITNSETYKLNMEYYGFPTFNKYLSTQNTYTPPPPAYEADYTSWLGTAVGGFLDFELFEGFSLGGLLSVLIGFSFIMLFLKFFAGG